MEAIDKVKQMLSDGVISQEDVERYFPELKESEDEKIRKCLLSHFSRYQQQEVFLNDITMGNIVSWLEKQGEQKSIEDIAKEVTKDKESAIKFLKSAGIMDSNGELAKEYRDEQNLVEWSENDERIFTELIGIFESAIDGGHVTIPYRLVKDYIRILKLCQPQPQSKTQQKPRQTL